MSDEEYRALQAEMEPEEVCPVCGAEVVTRVSFHGRVGYRNKRKTQVCECGWAGIVPTEWEARVQLGLTDD